jgi:hypothetical protein
MFRIRLYWNAGLGFWGPPVLGATFDSVRWRGKDPIFHRLLILPTPPDENPAGNIFSVEITNPGPDLRYIGIHPQTREEREGWIKMPASGRTITALV